MDDVKGPDTPECFEQMVSEYQVQLRRLCCVLLKDMQLAEDAVQETFLKAYDVYVRRAGRKLSGYFDGAEPAG